MTFELTLIRNFRSILNWENKTKSSLALFVFIIFTWNFELWMIPFALLLLLARKITHLTMTGGWKNLEDSDVVEAFDDIEEVLSSWS